MNTRHIEILTRTLFDSAVATITEDITFTDDELNQRKTQFENGDITQLSASEQLTLESYQFMLQLVWQHCTHSDKPVKTIDQFSKWFKETVRRVWADDAKAFKRVVKILRKSATWSSETELMYHAVLEITDDFDRLALSEMLVAEIEEAKSRKD